MLGSRKLLRRLGVALNLRDPPNLPPYGWSYFDHLVAVYVTLNKADGRADAVIKKSSERPDDLTWGDVFLLESLVFSLEPDEMVERTAWVFRERFREIANPAVYEKYVASGVPVETGTPAKMDLLRADLKRVLDILHWYYSLIPIRDRLRKSLTVTCLVLVLAYTWVLAAILIWCSWHSADFLAMLSTVLYCGIMGGFVSSQRRMQSIPNEEDPLISVFGLDNAGYYLWLSPLLGAIFAVTLAAMFTGGLLKGTLFPDFFIAQGGAHHGLSFFHFTWSTLPKSGEEYAKLFVWAFIAGFAERLVPDSLDRLASKISPGDKPRTPPMPLVGQKGSGGGDGAGGPAGANGEITSETLQDVMHTGEAPKKADAGSKPEGLG